MGNNSRAFRIAQGSDDKVLCKDGNQSVRYAISTNRNLTFVAAESTQFKKHPKRRGRTAETWTLGKTRSVCNFRVAGIQRLIQGRHGGPVNTDDGLAYFEMVLIHLVARNKGRDDGETRVKSHEWAQLWAPKLAVERGRAWFDEQEAKIWNAFEDAHPYVPSADEVADTLRITDAEVNAYALKTIGSIDRRASQRVAEQKAADAAYQADKRVKAKAVPHADSMARTKPWEALGMSRATYHRKIAAGFLPPDPRMKVSRSARDEGKPVLRLVRNA